jgi:asparagine synthase (glutamine-hydrolysing)
LTIYKEVREVPPGHYMIVNSSLNLNSGSYWRYPSGVPIKRSISFQDAVEKTDSLLSDAIRLRLRADVPVGVFLSGGIDSGLITAIASKVSGQQIKTFTVGFDSEAFDESLPARLVAKKYATDHSEIRLPSRLDDLLPEIVDAYDEPFADPSAVPTFAVAKAASSHIKVILNGEGADELFGGYRRHQAMKYLVNISKLVKFIPEKFWRIMVDSLPVPRKSRTRYAFFHRFSRGVSEFPFERYLSWGSDGFTEKEKSLFLGERTTAQHYTAKYLAKYFSWLETSDPVKHFMALDFSSMMVDSLLVKMDIATMAHGLEARCPFLDHRLVETVSCLPVQTLMSGRQSKPVLRELAKRYLPVELVTAPKRGFEIPLIQWMNDYLFSMTQDLCKSSNGIMSQLYDKKELDRLIEKPAWMDEERWAKRMWIIMMLALWDYQK